MRDTDTLHRFLFENTGIRGEWVRLDATFHAALERYDYPPQVAGLLGEALAAAALLSATIKFEGSLVLQLQGAGPLTLVVAQSDHERHLRGLARWNGEVPAGDLARCMGEGRLVITIDPGPGKRRYQGIVSLHSGSLAGALEEYFGKSEQIRTRIQLAGDAEGAAGILLQQMPGRMGEVEDEVEDEAWNRVEILASTVHPEELLRLSAQELLHRLFNEERVRLFEPEPVSFRCSCSRERIRSTLHGIGERDVRELLREHGAVKVACEFCSQRYVFDAVDVETLFSGAVVGESSGVRH